MKNLDEIYRFIKAKATLIVILCLIAYTWTIWALGLRCAQLGALSEVRQERIEELEAKQGILMKDLIYHVQETSICKRVLNSFIEDEGGHADRSDDSP